MCDSPVRVLEIRGSSLEPLRLSAPRRVRAREIVDIFDPQIEGSVTAVALPARTIRAALAPAGVRSFEEERYLTLRAVLGRMIAEDPHSIDGRVLRKDVTWLRSLVAKGLIATSSSPDRDGMPVVRLPVGSLGHLRVAGASLRRGVLINTHYFVLSTVELDSPFAAIGDPFGLDAAHGTIRNPPTVRRSALLRTAAGWSVRHLGADDLAVTFSDGTVVRGRDAGGRGRPADPSFSYRGDRAGGTDRSDRDVALTVCIQGDRASVIRTGGGLAVPHGALVASFPHDQPPSFHAALTVDPPVRISIPFIPDLLSGLQVGPELVRGGEVVVNADSFETESFHTLGSANPVGPVVFPADHDRTRAARSGVGVRADGTLVVIVVEGTSALTRPAATGPSGCTLEVLAVLLRDAGSVAALNLDGGGSAQVFQGSGALLSSADSRGVPGARFDRPVPLAAYFAGSR